MVCEVYVKCVCGVYGVFLWLTPVCIIVCLPRGLYAVCFVFCVCRVDRACEKRYVCVLCVLFLLCCVF